MPNPNPHFDLDSFLRRIVLDRHGFLNADDVRQLKQHDRLRQVLVRFQEGRAVVAAQDVDELIRATDGRWHVRDVSLVATDPAFKRFRTADDVAVGRHGQQLPPA